MLVLLQVGASQKLACVIDGESLMNDGSALVIFLLLQKIVEGEAVTVGGVSIDLLLFSEFQGIQGSPQMSLGVLAVTAYRCFIPKQHRPVWLRCHHTGLHWLV
jgi:NhaP-type Na+/H+ or K+/H+ antiporter